MLRTQALWIIQVLKREVEGFDKTWGQTIAVGDLRAFELESDTGDTRPVVLPGEVMINLRYADP